MLLASAFRSRSQGVFAQAFPLSLLVNCSKMAVPSTAVLVSGLDAGVRCSEISSLAAAGGPVLQTVCFTHSPGECSAVVVFASLGAAAQAEELLDGLPHGGNFLEVRRCDAGAAARLLAALAELRGGPSSHAPQQVGSCPAVSTPMLCAN